MCSKSQADMGRDIWLEGGALLNDLGIECGRGGESTSPTRV